MAITVAMIEEKEFKTKMRGYDPNEVDEFLDEICDEMVALQEEIATLNQRLSQASQQSSAYAPSAVPAPAPVVPVPAPVPAPAPVKKEEPAPQKDEVSASAQKLLARAQKVYDDTLADAQQEAEQILADAKAKAAEQIGSLEDQRDALAKEVDELKASAKDYRERFLRLIEDQQHVLKAETALFE
ncbi:MAG: DivIVA domain-containing protein [Clostridia bacterium]|nr:DivIVA domain-containing protein [Clostridia bacterium]